MPCLMLMPSSPFPNTVEPSHSKARVKYIAHRAATHILGISPSHMKRGSLLQENMFSSTPNISLCEIKGGKFV
jgi:hypothetical protein